MALLQLSLVPKLEKVLFVYAAETGAVLQVHMFSTVAGGKLPPAKELERSVMADASAGLKRSAKKLGIATLKGKNFTSEAGYRFNVTKRRLTRVAPLARPAEISPPSAQTTGVRSYNPTLTAGLRRRKASLRRRNVGM